MTYRLVSLLVLLSVWLALPASAVTWSKGCTGAANDSTSLGPGSRACWTFVDTDATTTSVKFTITGRSARLCFDPDTAATNTSTARLTPRFCPDGDIGGLANDCLSLGALDGTEGPAATQNACVTVGTGVYYFDITAACVAGDSCRASVQVDE